MSIKTYLENLKSEADLKKLFIELLNYNQENQAIDSIFSQSKYLEVGSAKINAGQDGFKIIF